jgi:hypothetical protein
MDGIQQQRVMRAERYQLEDLTLDPELQPREARSTVTFSPR